MAGIACSDKRYWERVTDGMNMYYSNADTVKKGEGGAAKCWYFLLGFFQSFQTARTLLFFYLNGFIRATIGDNDDGIVAINEIC